MWAGHQTIEMKTLLFLIILFDRTQHFVSFVAQMADVFNGYYFLRKQNAPMHCPHICKHDTDQVWR